MHLTFGDAMRFLRLRDIEISRIDAVTIVSINKCIVRYILGINVNGSNTFTSTHS